MDADKSGLIQEDLTELVIRAFFAVYNELGHGFLEQVYENALAVALSEMAIDVRQQVGIDVYFRGHRVGQYRADLLVPDLLLIEVKAATNLAPGHEAQMVNYLKATGIPVGLLLNFGSRPQMKRRVHSGKNPLLSAPIRPDPRT